MKRMNAFLMAGLLTVGSVALPAAAAPADIPAAAAAQVQSQPLTRRAINDYVGKEVISRDGKDAGIIFDLVVDSNRGRVGYAVIDHKRNGRLHAVPFELMKEEGGRLMVNVNKDKLEPSEGFTKDTWKDMGRVSWGSLVHSNYGLKPYWESEPGRAADKEKAGPKIQREHTWMNRVTQMVGIPLKNQNGEDLGKISDVVIDIRNNQGHVVYAVVSNTPGLRNALAIVPWSAIQPRPEDKQFVVNATKENLQAASLKDNDWRTMADPAWNRRVHQTFNEEPYWTVFGTAEPGAEADEVDATWQNAGPYLRSFDPQKSRPFTGKILSVGDFEQNRNVKGRQVVILADDDKKYTIHLGPASYFDGPDSKISLNVGDQISVRAIRGTFQGQEVYLADQLSKMIELRDSRGRGIWNRRDRERSNEK
jgi:sporulation protein YlmC with PRC-barrel domain